MDVIEKRARELLAAEVDRDAAANPGVEEIATSIREGGDGNVLFVPTALRAITAALLLGRPVDLLDQDGSSRIEPQELQVVPAAAFGADEAGAIGVDQVSGSLPGNVQFAEVTSEHEVGVRPAGDGQATADHPVRYLKGPATQVSPMVVQMPKDAAEAYSKARVARMFSIAARPEAP